MKLNKTFLRHLWALMIGLCLSVGVKAQTPYAVLSNSDTVLTFYYDDQKGSRGGMSVGPFRNYSDRAWNNKCETITTIVFDASFANCTSLTGTAYWFYNCTKLTTITGIENLNTDNVTDMSYMFSGCSSLTHLNLSGFKTEKVTDMSAMFDGCSSLSAIFVGEGWTTIGLTKGIEMFTNCSKLIGGMGTFYDSNHVDYIYANIDGGISNPGYLTDINAPILYAVLTNNLFSKYVLTFYYDNQMESRAGMSSGLVLSRNVMRVGPFSDYSDRVWNDNCETITTIVFDTSFANYTSLTSTAYWFYNCKKLTTITGIENLKTNNVTDMSGMFSGCSSLTSLDVSGFKTDNVTDMSAMFYACWSLTSLDVSGFKTDRVTNMSEMFRGCSDLTSLDVSGFKTDRVTNMSDMFDGCSNLSSLDVSSFKTENVTDMIAMFYDCSKLTNLDLSSFKTDNVTNMEAMFCNCSNLTSLDMSSFKSDNVTDMSWMFKNCNSLRTIYVGEGWTTIGVTKGTEMFTNCSQLIGGFGTVYNSNHVDHTYANIDGGKSNPGYLTGLHTPVPYAVLSNDNTVLTFYYDDQKESRGGMGIMVFYGQEDRGWCNQCETITTVEFDDSFVDYTELTSTAYWFWNFTKLTTITGVENLKTDNVVSMYGMFCGCSSLQSLDVSRFKTDNVTQMGSMFYNCSNLTSLDLSSFNTDIVTSLAYMFSKCSTLTSLDVSGFNTDFVTNMAYMFSDCSNLTSLDVSGFNTDNVTSMAYMFSECSNLASLDVSSFKTERVMSMEGMFRGCSSLTSLDLSAFNTEKVMNMSYMFSHCIALTSIKVSDGWTNTRVADGTDMFRECTRLIGGMGTSYDSSYVDHTYAHIDGGLSNPGYLIDVNSMLTIQIQDLTREYGDVNPSLSYIVLNGSISGTPEIKTTATITSPVGSYPITAERGSVTTDDYMVKNGTLTITKAPLTVSVKDYSRYWGEANPTFELVYSGFKNDETEAVLTQQPIVTCQAVADSPAGTYAINVSGGEATNYDLIYTNGTLTIKKFVFSFVLDNITYGVLNDDITTVSVVSVPDCEHIDIPASITYSDQTYTVTTLEDRAFYGLQQLKSVQIQASITTVGNEVFGNCPNLSAVFWRPSITIPGALLADVSNPNFLLYANASLWTPDVPAQIQNKIYDGVAKSITLTDGYPFYCPQEFIAEQISYTHEYKQETVIGKCQGWETIVLPFTVQTIAHEAPTKGNLAPFSANNASALPFWLYRMMESGNKFTPADKIQANTPYIISMPNNPDYAERFNLAGKVTFSAKDATVEASTALHPVRRNSVTFIPNFSLLPQTDNILALNRDGAWQDNPRGSIFRSHRDVQPFEAYIQLPAGVGVKEFRIADDDATDIRELFNQQSPIINPQIYDLSGRRIADGNKQVHSLRPGVYIHQGRKVLVK
ncbi:MAG: BspA family leucine-rich repeat surface protein [Bacteroidaceae bacterium]|nr:BspA family leucine-rich repeat surface protein [Bacteroidaceae bacterium]